MLHKLTLTCPWISSVQRFHPVHCSLLLVGILIAWKEKLGSIHMHVIYINYFFLTLMTLFVGFCVFTKFWPSYQFLSMKFSLNQYLQLWSKGFCDIYIYNILDCIYISFQKRTKFLQAHPSVEFSCWIVSVNVPQSKRSIRYCCISLSICWKQTYINTCCVRHMCAQHVWAWDKACHLPKGSSWGLKASLWGGESGGPSLTYSSPCSVPTLCSLVAWPSVGLLASLHLAEGSEMYP